MRSLTSTIVGIRLTGRRLLGILVGVNLVTLGVLVIWDQAFDFSVFETLWPLFIIFSGIVLMLSINLWRLAGIVTFMNGVLLQYFTITDELALTVLAVWSAVFTIIGLVVVAQWLPRRPAACRRAVAMKWAGVLWGSTMAGIGMLTLGDALLDYEVWENLFPLLIVINGAVLLLVSNIAVRILGGTIALNGALLQYITPSSDAANIASAVWATFVILCGALILLMFFVRPATQQGGEPQQQE